MIDGNSGLTIEREMQVKKIKRSLDNWREIVLHINSVLLWKRRFYPWIIISTVTFLFLEFTYYSPSFLTTLGLLLFVFTVLDYAGPTVSSMIWKQEDWNAAKERELEEICRSLACFVLQIRQLWVFLMELKASRPYFYFMFMLLSSSFLAILGNSINNILIVYIINFRFGGQWVNFRSGIVATLAGILGLLLMPGMLHYNILQTYYKSGLVYICNFLKSFQSTSCPKKVQ